MSEELSTKPAPEGFIRNSDGVLVPSVKWDLSWESLVHLNSIEGKILARSFYCRFEDEVIPQENELAGYKVTLDHENLSTKQIHYIHHMAIDIEAEIIPPTLKLKTNLKQTIMKPKVNNILVDLDGVLADVFTAAHDLCEIEVGYSMSYDTYRETHGKYDIAHYFGLTQEALWKLIDDDTYFWEYLRPFDHTKGLWSELSSLGIPLTISTAPSRDPSCAEQKLKWVCRELGVFSDSVMIGSRKYLMAKPDVLLIDDYPKNVDTFIQNGGQAVCVPSNWNTKNLRLDTVLNPIKEYLALCEQ